MTYEQFFEKVVDSLSKDLIGEVGIKTKEDVRRYVKTEEGTVKRKYKLDLKNYKAGKFVDAVWADCANSVAYCLYMMY